MKWVWEFLAVHVRKKSKKCKEFVIFNLWTLAKYIRSNKRFSE